jgi:hypothetical protein
LDILLTEFFNIGNHKTGLDEIAVFVALGNGIEQYSSQIDLQVN